MARKDLSELDVAAALTGIVPPKPAVELTAAFFHRTLARWLGLPEGRTPGRKMEAPLWDYDFWKAEIVDEGAADGRRAFTARVYRKADGAPESHRYWLKVDDKGRIRSSGWLGEPPDLLGEAGEHGEHEIARAAPRTFAAAPALDPAALAMLFHDVD